METPPLPILPTSDSNSKYEKVTVSENIVKKLETHMNTIKSLNKKKSEEWENIEKIFKDMELEELQNLPYSISFYIIIILEKIIVSSQH